MSRVIAKAGPALSKTMRMVLAIVLLIGVCVPAVTLFGADEAYADIVKPTSIKDVLSKKIDKSVIHEEEASAFDIGRFFRSAVKQPQVDVNSLVDTGHRIRTKATFVDASKYVAGLTIDDIMTSPENIAEMYLFTQEYASTVYDFGDSEYYAAFLDTPYQTGMTKSPATNALFAKDNDLAQMVNDCVWDAENGVAYIPKNYVETNVTLEGVDRGQLLQSQILCQYEMTSVKAQDNAVSVPVEMSNETTDEKLLVNSIAAVSDEYVSVKLVGAENASDVDVDSIEVSLNDDATKLKAAAIDSENASESAALYDRESGVLTINAPAVSVMNAKVTLKSNSSSVALAAQSRKAQGNDQAVPLAGPTFANLDLDAIANNWSTYGNTWFKTTVYRDHGGNSSGVTRHVAWGAGSGATDVSSGSSLSATASNSDYTLAVFWDYDFSGFGNNGADYRNVLKDSRNGSYGLPVFADGHTDVTNLDWSFTEKNAPKFYRADCAHISTPYSDEGFVVPAVCKVIGVNPDANTITLAFIAAKDPADNNQTCEMVLKFKAEDPNGYLKLKKSSADESISGNNACYDLAGYNYDVYAKSDNSYAGRLTTDHNGDTNTLTVKKGDYKIIEVSGPNNGSFYLGDKLETELSRTVSATVTPKQTTVAQHKNYPKDDPIDIFLQKADDGRGAGQTSGDIETIAGARYQFKYYGGYYDESQLAGKTAKASAIWQTDENGEIWFRLTDPVSGSWPYKDVANLNTAPLGTIVIQELSAPTGYLVNDQLLIAQIKPDSNASVGYRVDYIGDWSQHQSNSADSNKAADETPYKGGITVYKYDSDLKTMQAQGDATLGGAVLSIVNNSDKPVTYNGKEVGVGREVTTITTQVSSKDGKPVVMATTGPKVLQYGTYTISEKTPPTGYLPNASWSHTFKIREDGQMEVVNTYSTGLVDPVIRGGVVVGKLNLETGSYEPAGEAKLDGAVFAIEAASNQPIVVKDANGGKKTYNKGDVVETITTSKQVKDGKTVYIAKTAVDALPYGTYKIYEVNPPKGYLHTDRSKWEETFTIRKNHQMFDATYSYSENLDDASIASQVSDFAQGNGKAKALANQAYRSDFRFNKIVDEQERMSNIPFLVTSVTTGERHVIVTDENGIYDSSADWFSHEENTNKSDEAVTWHSDGSYTVDQSKLSSRNGIWFSGFKNKTVPASDIKGAFPYDTYTVEELRCDANVGYKLIAFTATLHRNNVNYDFGTKTDDQIQISTEIGYLDSMEKIAPSVGTIKLNDVVTYENLNVGTTYTVKDYLHLQNEDGTDAGVAKDANGREIVATSTITPVKSTGKSIVEFEFDASNLAGKTCTAFAYLYEGDVQVAKHEDISDIDQTIMFPEIHTSATVDGEHEADASQDTIIVKDKVSYSNFFTGKTYRIDGTLHYRNADGTYGGAVTTSDGSLVTAFTSFEAMKSSGEVEVVFEFPTAGLDLAGKTIVAYETANRSGVDYAVHADISDEAQTVRFPKITTSASDAYDDDTEVGAFEDAEITDRVLVENMTIGNSYKIVGELHNSHVDASGQIIDDGVVTDSFGNAVTNFIDIVAKSDNETHDVNFKFDATGYEGKNFVVFEKLVRGDKQYAEHEDIADREQTITVPKISTSAISLETEDNDALVSDKLVTVIDTVHYDNAVVGHEYTVVGSLVQKPEAEELVDKVDDVDVAASDDKSKLETYADSANDSTDDDIDVDMSVIVGSTSFTAESVSGDVDVEFKVNTEDLAGHTLVALEDMYHGEQLVARHADIADEEQSIHIPDIKTNALDGIDGDKLAFASSKTTIIDTVSYRNLLKDRAYTVNGLMHVTTREGKDLGVLLDNGSVYVESVKSIMSIADAEKIANGDVVDDLRSNVDLKPGAYKFGVATGMNSVETTDVTPGFYTISVEKGYKAAVFVYTMKDGKLDADVNSTAWVANDGSLDDAKIDDEVESAVESIDQVSKISMTDLTGDILDLEQKPELQIPVDSVVIALVVDADGRTVDDIPVHLSGYPTVQDLGKDGLPKNTVRSSQTFVPTDASGTVDVKFEFDASTLAGYNTVVFEDLYKNDVKLVSHSNIEDKDQTVVFPKIGTTLTTVDGKHEITAKGKIKLTDKVEFDGLVAGDEYKMTGVLHVSDESGVDHGVLMKDGTYKPIDKTGLLPKDALIIEKSFVADKESGSVSLEFEFDIEALYGKSVVAFEKLTLDGNILAVHEDITDKDQTVKLVKPIEPPTEMPQLGFSIMIGVAALLGLVLISTGVVLFRKSRSSK